MRSALRPCRQYSAPERQARDPGLTEARDNLAQALEQMGRAGDAKAELTQAFDADPTYRDAVFNLAGPTMKGGDIAAARSLYKRFLILGSPADWAATARKAITDCSALMAG